MDLQSHNYFKCDFLFFTSNKRRLPIQVWTLNTARTHAHIHTNERSELEMITLCKQSVKQPQIQV